MSISGKMAVGVVTMESPPRSRRPWCIETFRSITDSGGECDEPEPLRRQAGCGHALLPAQSRGDGESAPRRPRQRRGAPARSRPRRRRQGRGGAQAFPPRHRAGLLRAGGAGAGRGRRRLRRRMGEGRGGEEGRSRGGPDHLKKKKKKVEKSRLTKHPKRKSDEGCVT